MKLQIMRDASRVTFDRQLPVFNWPYPFDRDGDLLNDRLYPFLWPSPVSTVRRAVYIHVPFCDTICTFCPFHREKYKSIDVVDEYVDALVGEMELKRAVIGRRTVDAIFIGGGTPSTLGSRHIEQLGEALVRNFDLARLREFTCEVEVKSVTQRKLDDLRAIGVNRISFGAQTFIESYREIFSLDATRGQIVDTAALLNAMFPYTNVDVLYGMAGQTIAQLESDLAAALDLATTTIDVYPINNLSASRGMHILMERANLAPVPESIRVQFRMQIERFFSGVGYAPISGYGFSKDSAPGGDIIRERPKFLYHELVYGYQTDEILGYGSSALSQTPGFNLYNFADRRAYVKEILENKQLPHQAYGPLDAPERGLVTFPFRGTLEKSRLDWKAIPSESMSNLGEAIDAGLIADYNNRYSITRLGWLYYVNLMYYLMPTNGKEWLSLVIERQLRSGRVTGDTDLSQLRDGARVSDWMSAGSTPG